MTPEEMKNYRRYHTVDRRICELMCKPSTPEINEEINNLRSEKFELKQKLENIN